MRGLRAACCCRVAMSPIKQVRAAVVTGARHGFGAVIAAALDGHGDRLVRVARTAEVLADVGGELGSAFVPVAATAAEDTRSNGNERSTR